MSDAKIVGIRGGGFNGTGVKGILVDGKNLSEKEVLEICDGSGENAMGKGKVQYDFNPVDANGEVVQPGDPRLASGYVDSWVEQDAPDSPVDNLAQTGDESNTGLKKADGTKDDDHGCTPVAHIPSSVEGRLQFRTRSHWTDKATKQQVGEDFFTPYITVA